MGLEAARGIGGGARLHAPLVDAPIALVHWALGVVAFPRLSCVPTMRSTTPAAIGLGRVALHGALVVGLTPSLGIVAIPLAHVVQKSIKIDALIVVLTQRHPVPWFAELLRRGTRRAGRRRRARGRPPLAFRSGDTRGNHVRGDRRRCVRGDAGGRRTLGRNAITTR